MSYREHIEAAIRATVFHSPTAYSWFGNLSPRLAPAIKRVLTSQTARNYLLLNLQLQLYRDFYCAGAAAPPEQEAVGLPAMGMTPFVQELSAANSGDGYWADSWEVCAIEDGKVVVQRDGLGLWVHPQDCLLPQDHTLKLGIRLCLRFPKESLNMSPGFYMVLSDNELTRNDSQSLVRFYLNFTAEGAIRFVRVATAMLNRANIPFKLKVLNDDARFTRCDAVVFYIRNSDYNAISKMLETIYPEIAGNLKEGTPVFTKPLAAGIGLAEDPGQGDSFGLHRCRLLADGMIRAYEWGKNSISERLRVVDDRFAEDGISLEKPFLKPGSSDGYIFQPRHKPQSRRNGFLAAHRRRHYAESSAETFLQTAHQIGQRLSQEAVWYQDRCNWMGTVPHPSAKGQPSMNYEALGPELYSGTSGVALFLAELHAATGEASARNTAIGAIKQALSRVDALPVSSRIGFYTGWMGSAFAAARMGIILNEAELFEHAVRLLQRSVREHQNEHEFDLLSGNAGAIVALMVLKDIVHDASLLDFAVRLGDELLQTADETENGCSWKSPGFATQRNLTGFSHGTAGVGYALLELFHGTGESKYRIAAERAFEYERHWFDAEAGNWLDFREGPDQRKRSRRAISFGNTWCHGAPGIALSRLRAYEILKNETYKAEAVTALQTTHKIVEAWLHSDTSNYSLCHGLAGNAEVLLYGHRVLKQEQADKRMLAIEVADAGIEMYTSRNHQWPCGAGGGETPSLMLGLAGIGHFYLRLHSQEIPSILILTEGKILDPFPDCR
jgi:hypothetical protein